MVKINYRSLVASFLVSTFCSLDISPVVAVREGVYIIRSTIGKNGTTDNMTLCLDALDPPASVQELGDVVTNYYSGWPSAHWEVKKTGSLVSLTPLENPRNFITQSDQRHGYRFKLTENGTGQWIIERVIGRRLPQCLKNNGLGKSVTFDICREQRLVYPLSPYLWEFGPIADVQVTTEVIKVH